MNRTHPSWADIVKGIESAEATDPATRSHLRKCPRCMRLRDEAKWILGLFTDARLPHPPRELIEKAMASIRAKLAVEGQGSQPEQVGHGLSEALRSIAAELNEVWASLVRDSLQPTPELRGSSVASPRMLLYETDDYSVTISLGSGRQDEATEIVGQVTPRQAPSLPPGGWATAEGNQPSVAAPLSEFGEFRLRGLTPGVDEVSILIGDSRIRLRIPSK